MEREEENDCVKFLQDLKAKKKNYQAFESSLKMLQSYAAAEGLLDSEIDLLADVIMNSDLGAMKSVSLVKCLIPRRKFEQSTIKSIVTWWLASVDHLPLTISMIVIQWIVGVLDQQLACRRTVNLFYSVFFHVMLKKEKLERQLARLVYCITKPEDVTRRCVIRLLNLQRTYSRQPNHIVALLSLFKSYKPELVPEKIQSVNIESAWKPIPEPLRLMLLQAKARNDLPLDDDPSQGDAFKWNILGQPAKAKRNSVPLLPSVAYFQLGSGLFEQDGRSIFDIFSVEDLGKEQLKVKLPCNAVSLLSNLAGYHLLAFADFDYQSRFSYNLYNTLIRAFILEPEKCSTKDAARFLELTAEFSRYAQQGVPVVARFLDEYLYLNPGGEHRSKLLALIPWITSVSSNDLQRILTHLRNIFVESSLPSKIEIIRTLKDLVTNLFVNEGEEFAPFFLRQHARMENFEEAIEIVTRLAENFIVFGLTVHSLNLLLLAEALSFYEAISILEKHSSSVSFTLAPSAVIYCCLVTKNCAILSRVCELLLRYRKRALRKSRTFPCADKIHAYAEDIIAALWYDDAFKTRVGDPNFLCNVTQRVENDLEQCDLDRLLNVSNHYAMLPYKFLLREMGYELNTKEDTMSVALHYYPTIHQFLSVFRG